MTSATLIKLMKRKASRKNQNSINKQHKLDISSLNNVFLLITKFQQFIKQCLTNTIVYLSIIHFIIFYLISVVMDIVMDKQQNQKDVHYKCFLKRHLILREKDRQYYCDEMLNQLHRIIKVDPTKIRPLSIKDTEVPANAPKLWIQIFHTCPGRLVYNLSDYSFGFTFNDGSSMLSNPNGINLRYIDPGLDETFFTFESYPEEIKNKVENMRAFVETMKSKYPFPRSKIKLAKLPYILVGYSIQVHGTNHTLVYLSNHTFQLNFSEQSSMVLCPKSGTITCINGNKDRKTYKLDLIERYGCSQELFEQVKFSHRCLNLSKKLSKMFIMKLSGKFNNTISTKN